MNIDPIRFERLSAFAVGGTLAMLASAATAAEVADRAVCGVQQAILCPAYSNCERTLPGAINLPALLMIKRDEGVIESRLDTGETRQSKIASSEVHEKSVVLQGIDHGRPWGLRVDTTTGRFSLTSTGHDEGYLAFGLCSAEIIK